VERVISVVADRSGVPRPAWLQFPCPEHATDSTKASPRRAAGFFFSHGSFGLALFWGFDTAHGAEVPARAELPDALEVGAQVGPQRTSDHRFIHRDRSEAA
jgi:hypothetical protein